VHPISKGKCRKSLEEMKNMVVEEVLCMPNVTSFAISLVANKTFVFHRLLMKMGKFLWNF
jgi:hypothetical protein